MNIQHHSAVQISIGKLRWRKDQSLAQVLSPEGDGISVACSEVRMCLMGIYHGYMGISINEGSPKCMV